MNIVKPQDAKYWKDRPVGEMVNDWGGKTYQESQYHPHRELILHAIKHVKPFSSLLEVGCNSGPNLLRIRELYEDVKLAGIDVNEGSIELGKKLLPNEELLVEDVTNIPFKDNSFDIVLADAVYMYVKDINKALDEANRVSKKAIIICDWFSEKEEIKDFHYARNYPVLLEDRGYSVEVVNLTEKSWPNQKWATNGKLFIAQLR